MAHSSNQAWECRLGPGDPLTTHCVYGCIVPAKVPDGLKCTITFGSKIFHFPLAKPRILHLGQIPLINVSGNKSGKKTQSKNENKSQTAAGSRL
jgi:hypothetical protein